MFVRLKIAALVWIMTLLCAIPAAIATVLALLALGDWGVTSAGPGVLVVFFIPALVAIGVTRMTAFYIGNVSGHQIHPAPTIVGCAAGFLLAFLITADSSATLAVRLTLFGLLPMGGAVAGTLIPWPAPPLGAGALVGGLALVVGILAT